MASQVARRMFTTEEFHRMAQAGILAEDDRVSLPRLPRHLVSGQRDPGISRAGIDPDFRRRLALPPDWRAGSRRVPLRTEKLRTSVGN